MRPDDAFQNFLSIYEKYGGKVVSFNEADTRAKIIDSILKDCLDWSEDDIRREDHVDTGYTDYQVLINKICYLVIEAKKSGEYFELPQTTTGRTYKVGGVLFKIENLVKALKQVRNYCNDIGCKYAAVFNGYQLVVFSAITIGKPWTDGYCTVFNSLEDIRDNFTLFWNILASENVRKGCLIKYLEKSKRDLLFEKKIMTIHYPDQTWARNELYTYVQPISDYIFSEMLDEDRTEVLKKCYVFDRSNTELTTELEGYFKDKMPHFTETYKIKEIVEKEAKAGAFEKELRRRVYDSKLGSLIVLLGGIGCGKSTFLHRFFKILLADYENLFWFYIDFRSAPAEEIKMEDFTYREILNEWGKKYEYRLSSFLDRVGFSVPRDNPKEYILKLINLLSLEKFSISLIIDNVDRHDVYFQEKLFILANNMTKLLGAVTIVALREETFLSSTRTGVFDAYDIPKFHLSSPNFLSMIRKRIEFTINYVSDEKVRESLDAAKSAISQDIIRYFRIIDHSLRKENDQSRRIVYFIDSISVGNMREGLRMFKSFIISGNTNMKEIFDKSERQGDVYQIAYHQFIKSIILGEHRYYITNAKT